MTQKADRKRKEQQAILSELESIKDLLDEDELNQNDMPIDSDIDGVLDGEQEELLIHDDLITDEDERLVDQDVLEAKAQGRIDIPLLQEMVDDEDISEATNLELEPSFTHHTPPEEAGDNPTTELVDEAAPQKDQIKLSPGALPGQQSLFSEQTPPASTDTHNSPSSPNSTAASKSASIEVKPGTTEKVQTSDRPSTQALKNNPILSPPKKTSGENPFLPKHIRDRLSGTSDLPAYDNPYNAATLNTKVSPTTFQVTSNPEQDSTQSFTQNSVQNQSEHDLIIDSLVAQYLPEIEAKLRQKLKEAITSTKTKH